MVGYPPLKIRVLKNTAVADFEFARSHKLGSPKYPTVYITLGVTIPNAIQLKAEMGSKRLIAAFFAICTAWTTHAAVLIDSTVAGTGVTLPVPVGFTEPSNEVPILRSRAEQITPPQMRLLATYVDDSDLLAVQQGTTPNFKRYFLISVLRSKEADVLDVKAFRKVKSEVTGLDQTAVDHARDGVQRHLDSVARRVGTESGVSALSLKVGESRLLGVFDETATSISMLAVSRVSASNGTRELNTTVSQATSLVLLKGKVVFLAAYARIDNDDDYLWLREQSESWIRSALQSNLK